MAYCFIQPASICGSTRDLKEIVHAYVDKERMDRTDLSGETTITKEFPETKFPESHVGSHHHYYHHPATILWSKKDKQVTRKDLKTEYEIRGENISSWICEIIFKTSLGI